MDGKRGDSGDATQQWQEVTSDQSRSVRSAPTQPTNISAEEINTQHKQRQTGRLWSKAVLREQLLSAAPCIFNSMRMFFGLSD